MKDGVLKIKDLSWTPAITIIVLMLTCFGWTINRIDQKTARTDRLYEMFIDLLKEGEK